MEQMQVWLLSQKGTLFNLGQAVLILVVGWFAAFLVSHGIQLILSQTGLDNKIGKMVGPEGKGIPRLDQLVGKTIYYLVLVFVLIAFFAKLGMDMITEPLVRFLVQVTEYLPRLLAPAVLLIVAWIVASILKVVITKALEQFRFDQRFGEQIDLDSRSKVNLTKTLADVVYWLVFLLFLPAILDALALKGLLEPIQGMVDKVLSFVPSIFAAGLIFLVGWFLARIVQKIVTGILMAAGADHLSERVGLDSVLGKMRLSGLIGLLVYILILIPVIISGLNALHLDAVTSPASDMLNTILSSIPGLFAAAFLLVIAYVVGKTVAGLISNFLTGVGFDKFIDKLGVAPEGSKAAKTPSEIVGYLVIVAIMIFGSIEALNLVNFHTLASLLSQFLVFFGNILLGLVIIGVGIYLANLVSKKVFSSGAHHANWLALASKVAITTLAVAMALPQMGLPAQMIQLTFGCILGAIAIACAISFGIGGRDAAKKAVDEWVKCWKDS
jgi:hypothetical protein